MADYTANHNPPNIFDYNLLNAEDASVIIFHTNVIKERIRRTTQDIIEIGERLIDVKERLDYGHFGIWLRVEFDWDRRTAQRFMSVTAMLSTCDNLSQVPKASLDNVSIAPSALYLLAAPSTPEEIRREVLERAYQGEAVTFSEVKRIIASQKKRKKRATTLSEPDIASVKSFYKPGTLVNIECSPSTDPEYRHFNGRWGIVKDVGELGSIEVRAGTETMRFNKNDIQPIDSHGATFRNVAEQTISLLELDDLDELEVHILTTFYLRRKTFTDRQLEFLAELVEKHIQR